MIRREFIRSLTLSGSAALGLAAPQQPAGTGDKLEMHVRGFYCPTCAVGLETILTREDGILSAKATYPEGRLTVVYHAAKIGRPRIEQVIRDCGFEAAG